MYEDKGVELDVGWCSQEVEVGRENTERVRRALIVDGVHISASADWLSLSRPPEYRPTCIDQGMLCGQRGKESQSIVTVHDSQMPQLLLPSPWPRSLRLP